MEDDRWVGRGEVCRQQCEHVLRYDAKFFYYAFEKKKNRDAKQ